MSWKEYFVMTFSVFLLVGVYFSRGDCGTNSAPNKKQRMTAHDSNLF